MQTSEPKNNYVSNHANNEEEEVFNINGFGDKKIRLGFIKKVYLILATQLVFSAYMVVLSIYNESYRQFLKDYPFVIIIAAVLSIVISYALICYKTIARKVPQNYLLLALFTICEAYLISSITLQAEPELVLIAAVLTAGIVVSLTIYAITTKTDFTMMGGLLFMLLMTLILASFLGFFFRSKGFQIVISSFSVIVFGLYLIYDTQLIVGGKRRELSIDDYIVGALMLYIDIVQIFIELLRILSIATNN
jgi:FtsH-binding integral membrane protein